MEAEDDVLSTSSQPAAEQISPPSSETISMPATTTTTHAWDAMQCWQLSQRDVAHSRPASSAFDVLPPYEYSMYDDALNFDSHSLRYMYDLS